MTEPFYIFTTSVFIDDRVTLSEVESILRAHKEDLRRRFGVSSIAIFGSYAMGERQSLATWIYSSSLNGPSAGR